MRIMNSQIQGQINLAHNKALRPAEFTVGTLSYVLFNFTICWNTTTYSFPHSEIYESMESYLDLGMTNRLFFKGSSPLSSLVRQSTDPEITFHLQSTSVTFPL